MVGTVNEPADSGASSIYTNRRFTTTVNAVVLSPEGFFDTTSLRGHAAECRRWGV